MKRIIFCLLATSLIGSSTTTFAQQDKSQRPSPPATVTHTTNGTTVTINYSQPSVKGRTLGKEIAPFGKIWRTGANETTTFEVDKDVKIEGQTLPAGKYGLYTIPGEDEWTIVFNKSWNQWGTLYKDGEDALRVKVKPTKADSFTEKMTFSLDDNLVNLMWADTKVSFKVR